jgi:hypothetical protein
MPKSWDEKYRGAKPPHVTVLAKPFAGVGAGERLFIASPALLDERIRAIPEVRSTETFVYLKLRKQIYTWGTR